ncbi:MAG: hypothetical protein SGARI_001685 [Bacillariaceae sp.]
MGLYHNALYLHGGTVSAESFSRKVGRYGREYSNPKSAELRFVDVNFVEKDDGESEGEDQGAVLQRNLSVLRSLILKDCGEDSRQFPVLEQILKGGFNDDSALEDIEISHRVILDTGYARFMQRLFEKSANSLKFLELKHFEILDNDDATAVLFESLNLCQNLRTLRIEEWRKMQPKHFSLLSEAIRALPNLEQLFLCNMNMDAAGLSALLPGIAGHPGVSELCLEENPIGDEGAIELSKFLASDNCIKIERLSLGGGCEIWEDGWDALATGLAQFHTVKTLLPGQDIEQHLDKVLESLKVNMNLTKIDYVGRRWERRNPSPHSAQIDYFLLLNQANRKALMNEPISSRAWREAFEALKRCQESNYTQVEMFFYLLRHRPEMMDGLKR